MIKFKKIKFVRTTIMHQIMKNSLALESFIPSVAAPPKSKSPRESLMVEMNFAEKLVRYLYSSALLYLGIPSQIAVTYESIRIKMV